MRWNELDKENCSLARTVSVVGDRWTLLILRDCFLRVRRFDEFQRRLGITRHVLSDRLKKLEASGVLRRVPYGARPVRHEYRLTEKGLDLYPVILALVGWGDRHMAQDGPPMVHLHKTCGEIARAETVCGHCGEPMRARDVIALPGPGTAAGDERTGHG